MQKHGTTHNTHQTNPKIFTLGEFHSIFFPSVSCHIFYGILSVPGGHIVEVTASHLLSTRSTCTGSIFVQNYILQLYSSWLSHRVIKKNQTEQSNLLSEVVDTACISLVGLDFCFSQWDKQTEINCIT